MTVHSLSFQIPLIYRLQNLFTTSQRKILTTTIVAGVCSFKYHSIQILSLLFYPVLRYFIGFTWVMGFIQLWTGFDMVHLVAIVSKTFVKIQSIKLYGNIFGIGVVFPLLMYRSLKHKKLRLFCLGIMLVLMLGLSAIHPLSEVTVLNNPKNTNVILKPSLSNKATVLSLTDKVIDKDFTKLFICKRDNNNYIHSWN